MLKIKEVYSGYYTDIDILRGFSLEVKKNTLVSIIGPNGAGKSTLLKTIFGFLRPKKGEIIFNGEDITKLKTFDIVKRGISYIPQGMGTFPDFSVEDNLIISAYEFRKDQDRIRNNMKEVYNLFPQLKERRKQRANLLSGGQNRMLEIGMGIMVNPKMLLVDEPTAGLAPKIASEIYKIIGRLKDTGLSVLMVDQNIREAVKLSDYTYMMDLGKNAAQGPRQIIEERLREILKETLLG